MPTPTNLEQFYKKYKHLFEDPANENFVQDDLDEMIKDIKALIAQHDREIIGEFKKKVVSYALDQLEQDCLTGPGLHEQTEESIKRLKYWILEKEITNRAGLASQRALEGEK